MPPTHTQDWEDLARLDPCWAILSNPKGKHGKWDLEEFFRTGEREIAGAMEACDGFGLPERRDRALDFGCGVGRLTRALARHFGQAHGVDISASMVAKAGEFHAGDDRLSFSTNDEEGLSPFPDNHFDLVYTNRVLQHLPSRSAIEGYLREFVRVLRPGGLVVFQLLSEIAPGARLQLRRRLYRLLRRLGFNESFLYERLDLNPIRMSYIARDDMLQFLREIGAKVVDSREDASPGNNRSMLYYVTKP